VVRSLTPGRSGPRRTIKCVQEFTDSTPRPASAGSTELQKGFSAVVIDKPSPARVIFRGLSLARLRSRAPGPPPFSSMNSAPALSKTRLMTSRVARRGAAIELLPAIERRFRDAHLAAHVGNLRPALSLLERECNLLFSERRSPHRPASLE